MKLSEVTKKAGSHKPRKRLGRGEASGQGKTSGRGHKGCNARAGGGVRPLAEGGQMPLFRRLPKRGFNNANFRTVYEVVNVGDLDSRFEPGRTVNQESLIAAGLVRGGKHPLPIKILGEGTLSKKLTVEAEKFSKSAREKIAAVGGQAKTIG
ncbi:MAG: 50S ribosomal protein L15 [Phycisphaerae bacterium]|nr:50S ribosomal protein L15 [Phycisphaerae bacterium]